MKNLIYIFISFLGLCNFVMAQETETTSTLPDNMIFVGYEVAIPTNNDYLSETSWSGFRFEYRHMVTPNVSIGLAVSFNTFDEYFTRQTYQMPDGTGAITSDMIRQIYTSPMTASVHYYLDGNNIRPYVGLGLGAQYSEQNAYFNIYGVSSNNWGFVTRPEIGILGRFNSNVSGFLSVAYNYSTNKNESFNIDHLSQIPISIGLVFNP
jgi:outer membrane protein W